MKFLLHSFHICDRIVLVTKTMQTREYNLKNLQNFYEIQLKHFSYAFMFQYTANRVFYIVSS